jgi:1-acyl-sn-glycerol-3-phosphate acyltransferase
MLAITVNNSWKMVKFGAFFVGLGNKLQFIIHEPLLLAHSEDLKSEKQ